MRILVCWIAYPTASNLPLIWIPEFFHPLCPWIGIVVMWIDFCYLFLQFEYLFFPIGSGVSVVLQQQKVWLSNKNMAERQTLDQQHAVESQSPSASKEDMSTYVMALEAALLPCLPARELQAIDRSPHPSHQSESPCTLSAHSIFLYACCSILSNKWELWFVLYVGEGVNWIRETRRWKEWITALLSLVIFCLCVILELLRL